MTRAGGARSAAWLETTAGAARLDLRQLVLIGDGEAGDADADQQLVGERAPLARGHAPCPHAPRSRRRAARQHGRDRTLGALGWPRSAARPDSVPRGGRSGARSAPAAGLPRSWRELQASWRRGGLGRLPAQGLDEVEELALGLRRIGRRGHEALADRRRGAADGWRRLGSCGRRLDLAGAQLLQRATETRGGPSRLGSGASSSRRQSAIDCGRSVDLEAAAPCRSAARKPGAVGAQRRLAGRHVLVVDHARGRIRRALAGDGVIERAAERVDVGPGALLAAGGGVLLVGAVARLDERAHGLGVRGDLAARRAEVDEHRRAVLADDDVVGRDVAVQEIAGVHQSRAHRAAARRCASSSGWRGARLRPFSQPLKLPPSSKCSTM